MVNEKRRLAKTARTPSDFRDQHPMYQFAVKEFEQTVSPGAESQSKPPASYSVYEEIAVPQAPSGLSGSRSINTDSFQTISSKDTQSGKFNDHCHNQRRKSLLVGPDLPDATYEENYGEAYVGGPIRYIYPSGYQSMRPRSFPWKLSIVVSLVFLVLSIFLVGHCADQAEQNADQYYEDMVEEKWCGSRLIYLSWVASVLIFGLSTAYCLLIGYVKVRDFAIANSRSQPPGIIDSKSDYYVKIDDIERNRSIYQSDGTPQFWGAHIYRPTQAAVAVTSR